MKNGAWLWKSMVRKCEGDNGTWIQSEEAAYPHGGMTRKGRCLCDDGKLRAVYCGIPDTFFSIPAYRRINNKRINGYVYSEDGTYMFKRRLT